ncbi:hypothetical protein EX895_000246 [Sporisorium graminicola]|uniref:GST N-terminal domain-containing protein n=1 Tax=Sporisorium graminicola TaxID=280036 RepID=A0A4U7L2Z8_9BASI|nr:hypothetical protein EX895_000246 [Sporisorium graminicola]TKY90248.1 hypothetical protein EX895_000246 [Sporisorium graminicola]
MTSSDDKVLLYTAKVCPYAARAELALAIAGIPHEKFEVDLLNKPSWYAEKINKASKVPVLVTTKGETEFKLPESLVIVEYINDITGNAIFTSSSPQHRATARYIVERYSQLVQPQYVATVLRREASALPALKAALVDFNTLLKDHDAGTGAFVQGEDKFGYADLNIAPFVARVLSASKHGLLPESDEQGVKRIDEEVDAGAEGLERVKRWWDAVQAVKAWGEVWDEQKYLAPLKKRLAAIEAEKNGSK